MEATPYRNTGLGRALIAMGLAALIAATAGIAASFTAQASAEGTARTGKVAIALSAVRSGESPIVTGCAVENRVVARNTAERPCYVRVRARYSIADSKLGALAWTAPETSDDEGWVLAPDGWWYHTEPLAGGAECPLGIEAPYPFFEQVIESDGYAWLPVYGQADPSKWAEPSPDPADDDSLMTYEDVAGTELIATIDCEAVQADNFYPDFSAASPWGGTAAETSEKAEAGK